MSAWTKGPWKLHAKGVKSIHAADGTVLMCDDENQPVPWVPKHDADWHVIAAAPDLAKALAELIEEYDPNMKAFAYNAPRKAKWERARAALAKARGES